MSLNACCGSCSKMMTSSSSGRCAFIVERIEWMLDVGCECGSSSKVGVWMLGGCFCRRSQGYFTKPIDVCLLADWSRCLQVPGV
jgi:hypothetical protein